MEKECKNCGRLMRVQARGLCSTCYVKNVLAIKPNTKCYSCGKPIYRSNLVRCKTFYCTKDCMNSYRRQHNLFWGGKRNQSPVVYIETKCVICGKKHTKRKHDYDKYNNHYCSNKCQYVGLTISNKGTENPRYNSIELNCDFCSKAITRQPNQLKGRAHFFCSRKCFGKWRSENWGQENNPQWRGGHVYYYGPNWKRQAREARKRDDHTCQNCGMTEMELCRAVDVHHTIPFREFNGDYKKANSLSNLVCYCHPCHMLIEHW